MERGGRLSLMKRSGEDERLAEYPYWHPSKRDRCSSHPAVRRARALSFNRRRLRESVQDSAEAASQGNHRENAYARDRALYRSRLTWKLLKECEQASAEAIRHDGRVLHQEVAWQPRAVSTGPPGNMAA